MTKHPFRIHKGTKSGFPLHCGGGEIMKEYIIFGSATEVRRSNLQKSGHALFCDSWSGFAASSYLISS